MGILSILGYGSTVPEKERRKAKRRTQNSDAWVRSNGSFAIQPCKLLDMSSRGVRISVARPAVIADAFFLMTSRNGQSVKAAKVKWRRGDQIGAEFT
jgi:PilZ domain